MHLFMFFMCVHVHVFMCVFMCGVMCVVMCVCVFLCVLMVGDVLSHARPAAGMYARPARSDHHQGHQHSPWSPGV
jgi:hypothetical protein